MVRLKADPTEADHRWADALSPMLYALSPMPYLVFGTAGGSVRHGVGFHFAPLASFLNCELT